MSENEGSAATQKADAKKDKKAAPVQGILPGDKRHSEIEFANPQANPATNLD